MSTFQSFEQIEAWQKARELTRQIYECSDKGLFARDYGLKDQMRRASVSILSNIAEGFERSGTGEFIQFLSAAKGSAGELRAQLYVALDRNYIDDDRFRELATSATEIGRMIAGLMTYLRRSGIRGTKYKQAPNSRNLKLET
ncbi:MAG TPA: four helix bundle protein [Pyrinomonadaceae bacterium]|nr:four helix bundle protein [Pyrinomonadaceae bacterium]